jgi:hypothetical protein
MMVKLEDIQILFFVATLGCALIVASPALGVLVPLDGSQERFSELWLLGPGHMAEDYPFNVIEGEDYRVFVGVENNMGGSKYCMISVKLGNGSMYLPDIDGGMASSLHPVYEEKFFVGDGRVWEWNLSFCFEDVVFEDEVLYVGEVVVDGVSFPVDASVDWNSEKNGYFLVLFFELWWYDVEYELFKFDNRFVGLWLNMTISVDL